jgi:hypothetical protein
MRFPFISKSVPLCLSGHRSRLESGSAYSVRANDRRRASDSDVVDAVVPGRHARRRIFVDIQATDLFNLFLCLPPSLVVPVGLYSQPQSGGFAFYRVSGVQQTSTSDFPLPSACSHHVQAA